MESLATVKKNISGQTPTRLIYFCVFLAIVVCSSLAFSVYSFKEVSTLKKELHASRKPESVGSNVKKMEVSL